MSVKTSSRTTTKPIPRPFLKWAGGKTSLLPVLLSYVPLSFANYHEPFLGGGALFFALYRRQQLSRAFLSDVNAELIDAYRAVKQDVEAVIRVLEEYPYSKEFYYQLRSLDPTALPLPTRAARMIYLNKTGYNGLYRVNRAGKFNVPFGRYKNPNYKDFDNLRAVSAALQQAQLFCASFEIVLENARPGDFVYFDPPYDPVSKTANFTQYHVNGFGRDDQERLAEVFRELTQRGVFAMLSNADTSFIRSLYKDFYVLSVQAPRFINSKGNRRGPQPEVLVINYPPSTAGMLLEPSSSQYHTT